MNKSNKGKGFLYKPGTYSWLLTDDTGWDSLRMRWRMVQAMKEIKKLFKKGGLVWQNDKITYTK